MRLFKTDCISKAPLNTGRQPELDFVKALCIICMVLCHVFEECLGFDTGATSLIVDYLAQILGASTFMICMGIGMQYTRHSSSKDCFIRGFSLLTIGQILNIMRDFLPNIIAYGITGKIYFFYQTVLIFGNDILELAGLAFLLMALFKYKKVSPAWILLTAAVMNILVTFLHGVDADSYPLDQFLGNFIGTNAESYFPLLSWFIFPAFGYFIGDIYRRITDKREFFKRVFIICIPIAALYYWVRLDFDFPMMPDVTDHTFLIDVMITDAIGSILLNMVLIGLFYELSLLFRKTPYAVSHISKHINKYYCISWVCILAIKAVLLAVLGVKLSNSWVAFGVSIAILMLCYVTIEVYMKHFEEYIKGISFRTKMILYCLVWVFSFAMAAVIYPMVDVFPTYANDYLLDLL